MWLKAALRRKLLRFKQHYFLFRFLTIWTIAIIMSRPWEDEEELTEIEERHRSRVLIHDEITAPLEEDLTHQESHPSQPSPPPESKTPLAPEVSPWSYEKAHRSQRFLAFALDLGLLYMIHRIVGFYLGKGLGLKNITLLYDSTKYLMLYFTISLSLAALYYILMEGIWGLSLGKLICGLRIKKLDGSPLGFAGAAKRLLLKPLDYCPPFLFTLISMDESAQDQSLGDRWAGSQVLQKPRPKQAALENTPIQLAPLWRRLLAGLLDFTLALTLSLSMLAMMRWDSALFSYFLYLASPLVFLGYFAFLNSFGRTSPGKWIFKLRLLSEGGLRPHVSQVLLRTLMLPLDFIFAYALIALSPKRQRLGDLLAETQVYYSPKNRPKKLFALLTLLLVGLCLWGGLSNQRSLIKRYYNVDSYWDLGQKIWKGFKQKKPATKPTPTQTTKTLPKALPKGPYELDHYYLSSSLDPLNPVEKKIFYVNEEIFFVWESLGNPVRPTNFEVLDSQGKAVPLKEIQYSDVEKLENKRFRQALAFQLKAPLKTGNYHWVTQFPSQGNSNEKTASGKFNLLSQD